MVVRRWELFGIDVISARILLSVGTLIVIIMLGHPSAGWGAEWSVEPSMSAKSEYSSNLLLAFGSQKSTYGYWLSPATRFSGATESLQVSGRLATDFVQYFGGKNTTLVNVYSPLSVQYRDDRSTWGFNGGFTRDNTLRGELLQTGLVLAFAQRNLWSAAPTWTYNVTERVSAATSYQYQNATYDGGARTGLVGYDVHTGSETLSYKIRETDSVHITGFFTRFLAPDANDLRSYNYGVRVGGTHAFSEHITLSASGGPQFVSNSISTRFQSFQDQRTVWLFDGKLESRHERAQVTLDIGRGIRPSGFGVVLQTDHVGATAKYELTDQIALSLSGYGALVTSVQSATLLRSFPQSRFFRVSPQVNWRVGENWTVKAGYTYSRRERHGLDQIGEAHAAMFMLTYSPPKWSVGR